MLLRPGRRNFSLQHASISRLSRPVARTPSLASLPSQVCRKCLVTHTQLGPSRRRRSFGSPASPSNARTLATAMDDAHLYHVTSYDTLKSSILPQYQPITSLPRHHDLRPIDPSAPLMVQEPSSPIPRARTNPHGIPGDVDEMIAIFDACLRIANLDRAALVLKRLGTIDEIPGHDLILLGNRYLRASLEQLRLHPDKRRAEELHKWYELFVRSKGLPQTAETVACMLKASLLSEHQPDRLDRLVTRYMSMAPGDAGLRVLSMADILNDQDLAVITDICPTYNLAPDTTPATSDIPADEVQDASTANTTSTKNTSEDNVPEVLATPQKGFGLKTLKQTLTLFDKMPQDCDISTLSREQQREIQARLERDCIDAAVERWREENESLKKMGLNSSVSSASLNSRLYDWQLALEARLTEEMQKVEEAEAKPKKTPEDYDRCLYGPFLRMSTPTRLAAVTILGTLSATTMAGIDRGIALSSAISSLAKLAEEDIQSQAMLRTSKFKSKKRRVVHVPGKSSKKLDAARAELGPESQVAPETATKQTDPAPDTPWPVAVKARVGAALLSALIDTARIKVVKEHPDTKTLISQYQPAFSHATQLRRGKKIGMVLLNKELVTIMKREPQGDFLAKHLPMVVEPEPWSKFDKGGFLESSANLVRIKHGDKDQRIYTEAAIGRGDMDQVFKGLDVLGKTGWRINTSVFNVMLEVWNSGEPVANIPALNPDIPIPTEPLSSADPTERRNWIRAVKAAENERGGLHSVRCFINFQLEIARAFRNQTFYFPHNIDFRGRAYPLPTYLNHMGADHVRGLLRFAKGKELGEHGLKWLKVHLANVYGFDKASLKERESFAMDNVVNIFDSATKPLTGNRWWLQAEDPWQCLATCFELKAALESPDPANFVSHLPVHQDGTCNGLQHYAALGGDSWGARQVNLEPGDKPADVYSAVADIVKGYIAKDVEAGHPFALAVNGKITRKVVKQTVMTNVYGVTFQGAKKQVCKQLDALYPNLPQESGFSAIVLASYIASLIFKALSSMFRGAHDIQYWLGEIGGRVCRALSAEQLERIASTGIIPNSSKVKKFKINEKKDTTDDLLAQFRATIVWTTPLKMPVAQPYRKSGTRVIKTSLQDLTLTVPERSDPVNRKKQLQAFPPNFIHSLDATHMLLSALECHDLGLEFAAVHDSFWTHAANVDAMNAVLRDAFVRIHEEDVIGRLAAEFEARYKGSIYLAKVNQGTEVEKRISAWRKKARWSTKDELLAEYERQRLLKSQDRAEVERGRQMVTPASIFEDMSAADALAEPEDMQEIRLGDIPEGANSIEAIKAEEEAAAAAEASGFAAEVVDEEDGMLDDHDAVAADESAGEGDAESARLSGVLEKLKRSHFDNVVNATGTKKKAATKTIQIWLPLSFPAIPAKGDFDVQRLRKSEYFFS
ncbi:DNA-directed RNA polymerase [Sodiomyces alkalinus F11]|uniref:DNA-directed RNA polymerase n=1 Tax=Sodiomyces alkalinus (strain CBS 110278 / VKM F-3762 / F11) TaxID=1314773 RepID=A0A3N2Q656_SODAK|nr:DNA-directed RNA polymerase [Sodiomyces alkalinus F11]ROT42220.1 DNA-directed RNA polymerase [Sodiomyces alkalinus F11]